MTPRSPSAEFPNDNPDLHDGASWLCLMPCGSPRALVRVRSLKSVVNAASAHAAGEAAAKAALPADSERNEARESPAPSDVVSLDAEPMCTVVADTVVVVPEPEPAIEIVPDAEIGSIVGAAVLAVEPEPVPQSDAFSDFVHALVAVALDAGATRVAALLPGLLEQGVIDADLVPRDLEQTFVAGRSLVRSNYGFELTTNARQPALAWRRVLRGESDDLSACGASLLDGWAAELLGALIGASAGGVDKLRRELRRRGVAAFGMIAQAA